MPEMSGSQRDYDDIPGTYVFDSRQSQQGFALNMFCKSLDVPANREAFAADETAYLSRYNLTPEQREAILERQWLRMLRLGGNIYYINKLAIFDGKSMQYVGGQMSGMTEDEFRRMMIEGGRRIDG
jgi:protocatechuate 4,5-dioxygenase alpha chain